LLLFECQAPAYDNAIIKNEELAYLCEVQYNGIVTDVKSKHVPHSSIPKIARQSKNQGHRHNRHTGAILFAKSASGSLGGKGAPDASIFGSKNDKPSLHPIKYSCSESMCSTAAALESIKSASSDNVTGGATMASGGSYVVYKASSYRFVGERAKGTVVRRIDSKSWAIFSRLYELRTKFDQSWKHR
jgi:hypothetical protein